MSSRAALQQGVMEGGVYNRHSCFRPCGCVAPPWMETSPEKRIAVASLSAARKQTESAHKLLCSDHCTGLGDRGSPL
jgi:hypothetical protein